jgi:hypothetical protein
MVLQQRSLDSVITSVNVVAHSFVAWVLYLIERIGSVLVVNLTQYNTNKKFYCAVLSKDSEAMKRLRH